MFQHCYLAPFHTDTRDAAQNRLENYLAKGAQAVGSLLDTAYSGMKSFQVAMIKMNLRTVLVIRLFLVVMRGQSTSLLNMCVSQLKPVQQLNV
jgi:hypothetical protein